MGANKNAPCHIGYATAGQAKGTMPAAGSTITYASGTWASWTAFPGDLDDSDISVVKKETFAVVQGPHDQAPEDEHMYQNWIEQWEFDVYQVLKDGFQFDSYASESSGKVTEGTTGTKKAMWIEVDGIGGLIFPNCIVRWTTFKGQGANAKAGMHFVVRTYAYTGFASGWAWEENDGS